MAYRVQDNSLVRDLLTSSSDPLDINPVEYMNKKQEMRAKFISYVPEYVNTIEHMITLERIFNQIIAVNPRFDKRDVEEVISRIIK